MEDVPRMEVRSQLQIMKAGIPVDECDHPDMTADGYPTRMGRCPDCGLRIELEDC